MNQIFVPAIDFSSARERRAAAERAAKVKRRQFIKEVVIDIVGLGCLAWCAYVAIDLALF
jgi:hypothetical protein